MTRGEVALTVVIAASDSPGAAARTVASLGDVGPEVEVIAVVDDGADVPEKRRIGLDRARGAIVAFTEDSCILRPGWLDAWIAAFADPAVNAATGPVVEAMGDRPVDRAVFAFEYAPFVPGRVPDRLAGNNFAIRRALRRRLDPRAVHETEVPGGFAHVAGAVAGHVRRYRARSAIADRLRFGHDYGRRRASTLAPPFRWIGWAVGPMILMVQAGRLAQIMIGRGTSGRWPETLPWTLALLAGWSVGEWLGWIHAIVRPIEQPASRR